MHIYKTIKTKIKKGTQKRINGSAAQSNQSAASAPVNRDGRLTFDLDSSRERGRLCFRDNVSFDTNCVSGTELKEEIKHHHG